MGKFKYKSCVGLSDFAQSLYYVQILFKYKSCVGLRRRSIFGKDEAEEV